MPARELMQSQLEHATLVRDALIRGDAEEARGAMSFIAEHQHQDSLPEALRPDLLTMQAEARAFEASDSLLETARAYARMLGRCGHCHAQVEGGPRFEAHEVPEGEDTRAHMRRHRYALNRMWEGLLQPSPENFRNGVAVLNDMPLHPEEVGVSGEHAAQVRALAELVHRLGEESVSAHTDDDRQEIFARFIASCAGCHRMTGRGPSAAAVSAPE